MELDKDYLGHVYAPEIYLVEKKHIEAYASAIGASDPNYGAPPCFLVTYEVPLIYEILNDPGLQGFIEQAKKI